MKILHVITGLNTGGAERMLVKLIESTNRVEHSVISLLDKGSQGEILEKQGVSVRCLNMNRGIPSLSKLIQLRNFVSEANPNVIQSWMYHANVATYFANMNKNYPLIFNIRHALNDFRNEKRSTKVAINLNSVFSRKVEGIIFNSEMSKDQHVKFGLRNESLVVIPNGFDIEKFQPNDGNRLRVRNYYKIAEDEILIGAVGRNHSVKGFDVFLKGCSLVAKQIEKVKFILIGKGIKEDEDLRDLSCSLGINDSLIFENERDDLEKVWPAIDIYCNSSRSEAFSNTIGEAMLNEIPCIVTDVGDSAKIVGSTGIVVQPNEPKYLAKAILEICNLNKTRKNDLGISARKRIKENFSISKISDQYLNLYKTLSNIIE